MQINGDARALPNAGGQRHTAMEHFGGLMDEIQPQSGELMKRYGRDAIPLYLVFDTRGELLGRIQGAADAETFMDNLRTIIARQKPHKQQP